MEEEFVNGFKYMVYYYPDFHYGHEICYDYFIGDSYNMIIRYKYDKIKFKESKYKRIHFDDSYYNEICIFNSNEPKNQILNPQDPADYTGSILYPVKIPKKWVDECFKCLQLQNETDELKNKIFKSKPKIEVPSEIFNVNFNQGYKKFNNNRYNEAIKHFTKCLEYNTNDKNVLYMLAHCHKKINNDIFIDYLNRAIDNGYSEFTKFELDFKEIKHTNEFKKCFNKIKENKMFISDEISDSGSCIIF